MEPLVVCPVVITYRCTIAVQLRSITFSNECLTTINEAIDRTGLRIELRSEILAIYHDDVTFRHSLQSIASSYRCNRSYTFGCLDSQLFFHLCIALLSPWHIGTKEELYLHKVFALCIEVGKVIRQSHYLLATWQYSHARALYRSILLYAYTILPKWPYNLIIVQWFEVVFIEDLYLALLRIEHLQVYVLVYLLHFIILWFASQVRHHNTVHTEGTIVWFVTKVTTIAEETVASLLVVVVKTMVNPFPDSTTDEEVGTFHRIPIIHQVTTSVTHRVSIFRNMIRILDVVLTSYRTLYPCDRRILVGTYIYDVVVTFVLYRATLIECLDSIVSSNKVITRTCFVTQTPQTNWRMIDTGMYHFHITGNVCILPFYRMRSTFLTIVILVAFDVRFVFQVDTILVAQPIPIWSTWIVRVTYVIDIGTLHHHHFFGHTFTSDVVTTFRICFVTVYPFHLDRLTIQVIVTTRQTEFILIRWSILDFDFTETDSSREGFNRTSLLVLQFTYQGITVRLFSIPRLYSCTCIEHGTYLLDITRKKLCNRHTYSYILHQGIFIAI